MTCGTRGAGVVYNLAKSPYRVNVGDIVYVFSSQLHADKFSQRLGAERERISASLSNRFDLDVEFNTIADMVLYRTIEKRGFRVEFPEGVAECRNSIKYVGGIPMLNNLQEK